MSAAPHPWGAADIRNAQLSRGLALDFEGLAGELLARRRSHDRLPSARIADPPRLAPRPIARILSGHLEPHIAERRAAWLLEGHHDLRRVRRGVLHFDERKQWSSVGREARSALGRFAGFDTAREHQSAHFEAR